MYLVTLCTVALIVLQKTANIVKFYSFVHASICISVFIQTGMQMTSWELRNFPMGMIMLYCSAFLAARRYASAGNSDRNVSVCPSVCHTPVLCQNEES